MERDFHRRAGRLLAFVFCLTIIRQGLCADEPAEAKKDAPAAATSQPANEPAANCSASLSFP